MNVFALLLFSCYSTIYVHICNLTLYHTMYMYATSIRHWDQKCNNSKDQIKKVRFCLNVDREVLFIEVSLNSNFFWNWCNVNPNKIAKCDQLWFKGFVSIILNPFLRVFAISAFLKVIHAPKTSHFRYPKNNLPTYIFSNPCNWDFP